MPGKMKLRGITPISASAVARSRYVNHRGKVRGYYSGYTFANQIGLPLQVPYAQEIVTNEASAKVREIDTYISLYQTRVYKNLYETGVVYAIAQGERII